MRSESVTWRLVFIVLELDFLLMFRFILSVLNENRAAAVRTPLTETLITLQF